jgi:5,10-methylenetetrahydromethanopterin reductase
MITKSINLIPEGPVAEMVAIAAAAEQLGFERCWVYDEGLATRDVYVTMSAIAGATTTMAVGPGITNPYTRHPAQTAAAIASLDELTGGRAFLGIGAGGSLTLNPLAIDRHTPLSAVEETIDACRALWSGQSVDADGRHVNLRSARLGYGRADIEVWLAGRGPRMLALGGAKADGVMLDFIHQPTLDDYTDRVRQGGAGRRSRLCYSTAIVTDEDDLDFVRPHMTYRLVDAPQTVKDAIGLSQTDVARIRGAMAGGLAAAAEHVRDEWILPFVIAGSVGECRLRLAMLMDQHGFEEFLLPVFDMDDTIAYLGRVAEVLDGV